MRKPCKFTEADLRRAMRAATKEHLSTRIDIMPDGRISIIPIPAEGTTPASSEVNEWDDTKL